MPFTRRFDRVRSNKRFARQAVQSPSKSCQRTRDSKPATAPRTSCSPHAPRPRVCAHVPTRVSTFAQTPSSCRLAAWACNSSSCNHDLVCTESKRPQLNRMIILRPQSRQQAPKKLRASFYAKKLRQQKLSWHANERVEGTERRSATASAAATETRAGGTCSNSTQNKTSGKGTSKQPTRQATARRVNESTSQRVNDSDDSTTETTETTQRQSLLNGSTAETQRDAARRHERKRWRREENEKPKTKQKQKQKESKKKKKKKKKKRRRAPLQKNILSTHISLLQHFSGIDTVSTSMFNKTFTGRPAKQTKLFSSIFFFNFFFFFFAFHFFRSLSICCASALGLLLLCARSINSLDLDQLHARSSSPEPMDVHASTDLTGSLPPINVRHRAKRKRKQNTLAEISWLL